MPKNKLNLTLAALAIAGFAFNTTTAAAKPLKVYILAGQSNMEGHADVSTFDYIGNDPATAPLLKEMRKADGSPRVCDNVWITYFTGWHTTGFGEGSGKLTTGYGARGQSPSKLSRKIGPEYTFGITMDQKLNEPILIIKFAVGGKSLHTDYRPPSAGPYPFSEQQLTEFKNRCLDVKKLKADKAEETGRYYRMMMAHVNKTLKDIKRVCPVYDEKQGYELAGFVWFQGFNDLVDGRFYPNRNQPGQFDAYSELLATFIRDVRKDLSAPEMRFVIGVLGVGGEKNHGIFRQAMAAPAAMPEFKGNVVAVETAPFWDYPMEAAQLKDRTFSEIMNTAHALNKDGSMAKASQWHKGWKPIAKMAPQDQVWRYTSFDPQQKKDRLSESTKRRFRDVTLPAGLKQWAMPGFDDSQFKQGKAPIGKGAWKHSGITVDKPGSAWGDGEFLLMRTTFDVADLDYASYRLSILAKQGFHVYLNGHKIHTYVWWQDKPFYRSILLKDAETKHLKKGANVLAVYANDMVDKGSTGRYGAIDLWIEGITKPDKVRLDKALEKLFPLQERDILKGASNGGYHYLGSAKIMGQIGKAFAEAMETNQK